MDMMFGHSPSIIPIETLLGLFTQDPTLKADNYEQQKNRAFKYVHKFVTA